MTERDEHPSPDDENQEVQRTGSDIVDTKAAEALARKYAGNMGDIQTWMQWLLQFQDDIVAGDTHVYRSLATRRTPSVHVVTVSAGMKRPSLFGSGDVSLRGNDTQTQQLSEFQSFLTIRLLDPVDTQVRETILRMIQGSSQRQSLDRYDYATVYGFTDTGRYLKMIDVSERVARALRTDVITKDDIGNHTIIRRPMQIGDFQYAGNALAVLNQRVERFKKI